MSDAILDEELVQRLQKIAEREHRSVTEVVRTMVEKYDEQPSNTETETIQAMLDHFDKRAAETSPLEALIDMFDDVEATDLSIKATGHMGEYFVKKHDDSD